MHLSNIPFEDRHRNVKDWTIINRYETRHNNYLNAIEAMQHDLERSIININTDAGASVKIYLNNIQEDLDKVIVKKIFPSSK